MPLVPKQVLSPGTFVIRGKPHSFSKEDVRGYFERGQAMRRKGLPIRFPAEHHKEALPLPLTDAAMKAFDADYNRGFTERFFLDSDDTLWALQNIPDPAYAKHVQENVKYVSPAISNFQDSDGQVWTNVITHIAATPNPVDFRQKPFGTAPLDPQRIPYSEPVAMSLALADGEPLCFSMANAVARVGDYWQPIQLSQEGRPMADEPKADDKKPDEKPAEKKDEKKTPAGLDKCKEMLQAKGITLPDFTDEASLIEHLIVACTALCETTEKKDEGDMGGAKEEPMQMLMSQTSQLQEQVKALLAVNAENSEKLLLREIEDVYLDGKMSPLDRNIMRATVTAKKMSLGAPGLEDRDIQRVRDTVQIRKSLPKYSVCDTRHLTAHLTQEKREEILELSHGSPKPDDRAALEALPSHLKNQELEEAELEALGKKHAAMA